MNTSLSVYMNRICGDFSSFAFYTQNSRSFFIGTLQQYLGKSVKGLYLISPGIPVCRTFTILISGISVAYSQDAYRTVNCQLQRYTSCRSEVLSLILKLHIDNRYIPIVCLYGVPVCTSWRFPFLYPIAFTVPGR